MNPPNQSHPAKLNSGRFVPLLLLALAITLALAGCTMISAARSRLPSLVNADVEAQDGSPVAYLAPVLGDDVDWEPTPMPTMPTPAPSDLGEPLPAPTVVVALPPVDFASARTRAQGQGLELAYTKIGFHVAVGGNANGLGLYMRRLNDAGVPFFLKSANNAGPLFEAQEMMKANAAAGREVEHTLVFRLTDPMFEAPYYNYGVDPETAAEYSWNLNKAHMPRELDPSIVWFETLNEPGRIGNNGEEQIERLARFSLATARLAVAEGARYAALSWSTGVPSIGGTDANGEPLPNDWEHPAMLEFLRYAGEHPDQVAISIHEYSLVNERITRDYPYLLGRFQALFDTVDRHGIPRPTILITEWGWEYNSVPEPAAALEDIAWASWLYAAYPTVKGAAIWYLGPGFGNIHNEAQRLIAPLTDYAVSHYFLYHPGQGRIDPEIFRPSEPTLLNLEPQIYPTPYPRPSRMP